MATLERVAGYLEVNEKALQLVRNALHTFPNVTFEFPAATHTHTSSTETHTHTYTPVEGFPELWCHVERLEQAVEVAGHGLVHEPHKP